MDLGSVFVQPRPQWKVDNVSEFFQHDGEGPLLSDIEFTEMDMEIACSELCSNSAAGADGVPSSLLKQSRKELRQPLFILWRASLDRGLIPPDLLLVLVSPVNKGGSRYSPTNYRPVAKLPMFLREWSESHLWLTLRSMVSFQMANMASELFVPPSPSCSPAGTPC